MIVREFKLDSLVIHDIPDLGDLKEVIEMDNDLKSWSRHYDNTKLKFWGDGFQYLKGLKQQYGYNRKIAVTISLAESDGLSAPGDVINGFIYLTDIKIQHTKNYLEVELIETYSEGILKQNWDKEVNLFGVATSLNGIDISAYSPARVFLHMFDPNDGTVSGTVNYGVNMVDAIKFLLKYSTDDQLGFRDDYFLDTWGSAHKFTIINGYELRLGDHKVVVKDSLKGVLEEAFKLFNVWWYIDYSTYKPTFVIANYRDIIAANAGLTWANIRNIQESFYQENFYSSIDIGTKTFILPPTSDTYWLKFFNGFTADFETYVGRNDTMIDQKLDLVSNYVIDHNVITEVVKLSSTLYDNETFIIEADQSGMSSNATQFIYGNLETDTRKLYNENLLNVNRLARFDLPVNVGFDSGSSDDNFVAHGSSDYTNDDSPAINIIPYPYDTEVSDPNNNYDPTLSKYTCPTGADGNYGMYQSHQIVVNDIGTADCVQVTQYFDQYYASGTLKASYEQDSYFTGNTGTEGQLVFFNKNILMNAGDYIIPRIRINDVCPDGTSGGTSNVTIKGSESYFKTLYVQNLGGLLTNGDIKAYYGSKVEFDKYISINDWKSLKANMIQDITVTKGDGRMTKTKASKIERKIISGAAKTELITKSNKLSL